MWRPWGNYRNSWGHKQQRGFMSSKGATGGHKLKLTLDIVDLMLINSLEKLL